MPRRYEGKRPKPTPERHKKVVSKMQAQITHRLVEIDELLKNSTPKDAQKLIVEKNRLMLMVNSWK